MSSCVIFGGGELQAEAVHIPDNALVIAADSGYGHCKRLGIAPDIILGDFDSYDDNKLPENIRIIRSLPEKDDTDMMLAVKTGFERGADDFIMYGALGGRMGHTLANLQTLEYIESHGGRGIIVSDSCTVYLQTEGRTVYENKGFEYISVFSVTDTADILEEGMKYGGRLHLERSFPLGVSNEFSEERAEITVLSGKILVICEK